MRNVLIIAGLVSLLPALSYAQSDSNAAPGGGGNGKMRERFEQRFNKADTNGDGKLSKAEAQAGMPRVAKNFDAIDTNHDGFVTKEEIGAAMASRRAARKGGGGDGGDMPPK